MTEKADIHLLVRTNDIDAVRLFLYMNPKDAINKPRPRTGESPLHLAVDGGMLEMVDLLLSYKPNLLSTTSASGWTPLHVAVNRGIDTITRKLMIAAEETGTSAALLETVDRGGMNALHVATVAGHLSTLRLLVEVYLSSPARRNRIGDTPLHLACLWGHLELVAYLLDLKPSFGVNVREQNERGNTALHRACEKGHSAIVNLLTLRGANLFAINHEGLTPIDISSTDTIKQIK
jgi:ankyrin repeat protein